jgi:hypothetical protein
MYDGDIALELKLKYKDKIRYKNDVLFLQDPNGKWCSKKKEVDRIICVWLCQSTKIKMYKYGGIKKMFIALASVN